MIVGHAFFNLLTNLELKDWSVNLHCPVCVEGVFYHSEDLLSHRHSQRTDVLSALRHFWNPRSLPIAESQTDARYIAKINDLRVTAECVTGYWKGAHDTAQKWKGMINIDKLCSCLICRL